MNKTKWLASGALLMLIAVGWFVYQQLKEDPYQGMSIIPEEHDDIPLFNGLELDDHQYVLEGDRWIDIHQFYLNKLPELGWDIQYQESALDDHEAENDWGGFYSRWRKEGFDGELTISANFNSFEEQTEVIYDKNPIHYSTTWVSKMPENICIYKRLHDNYCSEIKDKATIRHIIGFVNEAIDWEEEEMLQRKKTSRLSFGDTNITVLYGDEEEIYFQSDKGTKVMKPEPDFFEYTDLSQ
ncbi:hypothetical protein [Jeotgalibacillus aurantiacus]|uniref:hypothetical protein n=1 Tax=Jeotgalibacillus aurantiacus TaxID=2763266 RepID=UPI001D09BDA8|nr:hypothetical protein [Jeotgalibacillus aurantiacus]